MHFLADRHGWNREVNYIAHGRAIFCRPRTRGERDRGNAALLFTTVVAQLVTNEPALASHVRVAIESDPSVTRKALKEQFEKLI